MKIRIDNCILSFPVLFNAQSFRDSDPAFSATFIVDENTKFIALDAEITGAFDEFQRAVQETAGAKWGAKARAVLKTLEAQDRLPYHDGNMKSQYEGFEGHMYLSARSASRPMLLDRDGSALSAEDGKLYAGARVNARINLWALKPWKLKTGSPITTAI